MSKRRTSASTAKATSKELQTALLHKTLTQPMYRARGLELKLNLHDWWIGMFWRRSPWPWMIAQPTGWRYDVYVCLLPCLPFHFWWSHA